MNKTITINNDMTDIIYTLDGVAGLLALIGEAAEDPKTITPSTVNCPAFRLLSDLTAAAASVLSSYECDLNIALRTAAEKKNPVSTCDS